MYKWNERFNNMTMDKKISSLLMLGIVLSSAVVLTISTFSSISSMTSKSEGLVKSNVETVAKSLESTIDTYYSIATAMIPEESIQTYLKEEPASPKYAAAAEKSQLIVSLAKSQKEKINFIGLYKSQGQYIYRGQTITTSRFTNAYSQDLEQSVAWGRGDLRISYGEQYYGNGKYTISFYQPVYDMNKIGRTIGMLCINVNADIFDFINSQQMGDARYDMYIIDKAGNILYCEDNELVGTQLALAEPLSGKRGTYKKGGKICAYERIDNSSLYIMGQIESFAIVSNSFITAGFLIVTVFIIAVIELVMVSKIVALYFRPLKKLVSKMNQVSQGNLDIRMDEIHSGQDFITISKGFNHMMEQVNLLMEQVKLEQHQIEQIKFNALQAQIKPHFLYNALDCIHWQAAVDGNKKISTLAKALANYYRTCLSRGRDIITLGEELEHIKSYLIIQNIRYDNILDSEFCIDRRYYSVKIPKMTLQPLIENAIYHGIKTQPGRKGLIILSAEDDASAVIVKAEDNGQGMSSEEVDKINRSISEYDESFGYGVRNVNKRIELSFGAEYGLHYELNGAHGITVNIRLPKGQEREGE